MRHLCCTIASSPQSPLSTAECASITAALPRRWFAFSLYLSLKILPVQKAKDTNLYINKILGHPAWVSLFCADDAVLSPTNTPTTLPICCWGRCPHRPTHRPQVACCFIGIYFYRVMSADSDTFLTCLRKVSKRMTHRGHPYVP